MKIWLWFLCLLVLLVCLGNTAYVLALQIDGEAREAAFYLLFFASPVALVLLTLSFVLRVSWATRARLISSFIVLLQIFGLVAL